jgi:tetratricopeptide (TPR) repeat protein
MKLRSFARFGAVVACVGLVAVPHASLAAPAPAVPAAAGKAAVRNDYADKAFADAMATGFTKFYTRDFPGAQSAFKDAAAIVPDNTLALSFGFAAATHVPGTLDTAIETEEDALAKDPKAYDAHVRLGFAYLFASETGRDRTQDAREEFNTAVQIDPARAAAHVGLGIMRFNERSQNRAKVEFLEALDADRSNVLAREYLGLIYQELKDPQRALSYVIDVPNLVPGYADIDFHIASILQDLNQPDAAIKYATLGVTTDIGHVGEAGQHGFTLLAQLYLGEKKVPDARRVLKASIDANVDAAYAQTLMAKIDHGDYAPKDTDKKTASKP